MDRRQFAKIAGASAVAMAWDQMSAGAQATAKPNVILILVDDLGWSDLGCYGSTFCETPNTDRLADQGMRFTDAYAAAPVCSPTRAALLTGRYPLRVGITDYLRADDALYLSPALATMPKLLGPHGYVSGLIGKWHLMGDYRKRRGDPKLHGFEEVICSEDRYIGPGYYFHPYDHLPGLEARLEDEYLTDRLNLEAVDFITRHKDEPFFLYLSHYAVHTRLVGKRELVEKYSRKPGAGERENNPALAAMLESIDEGVSMVMARLEEAGIADNTILIFTSDNGGEHKVTSNAPLRGGKSQLYEGGIRVPLIVRWPGVVEAGSSSGVPVTSVDFLPTILEMAGAVAEPPPQLDGESLVPVLTQTGGLKRDAIFWHYPLDKPHFLGGRSAGAVRQGAFKVIEFYDTGEVELYDVENDVGETKDLSAAMPDKATELRKLLADWREA